MTDSEKIIWSAAFALGLHEWEQNKAPPGSFNLSNYAVTQANYAIEVFRDLKREDVYADFDLVEEMRKVDSNE